MSFERVMLKFRFKIICIALFFSLISKEGCAFFCHNQTESCSLQKDLELTAFKVGFSTNGIKVLLDKDLCDGKSGFVDVLGSYFSDICSVPAPCKVYTEIGVRIHNCTGIVDGSKVIMVPKNRHFMWPTFEVGHISEAPHVQTTVVGEVVKVETLSISPKVFKLHNFFSAEEATTVVNTAMNIQTANLKMKRSGVGTGADGHVTESTRTSENAFDPDSEHAMTLKHRTMKLLGFDTYAESWIDGLQILRYQLGQAYIPHLDAFTSDGSEDKRHNYESHAKGTNRFATVLLYLSDVELGGETVFPKGRQLGLPEDQAELTEVAALHLVQQKNLTWMLERGSWEEKMVADCNSRLATKPSKGEAILFYSQLPDGYIDQSSLHGGCPVLEGIKWAANIWVWNGPRAGLTKVLPDGSVIDTWDPVQKKVAFRNYDLQDAELFYEDNFFANLPVGQAYHVSASAGHRFSVRVRGQSKPVNLIEIPFERHYYEGFELLEVRMKDKKIQYVPI